MTQSSDTAPASSPTAQKTALVVDSGPEINDLLDSVLKSEGWDTQSVPDNQAVLDSAASNSFDLIITGAKTRGPEDIELLRKIRTVCPHVRLIILTDEWTPGDVIAAMRYSLSTYFAARFLRSIPRARKPRSINLWDSLNGQHDGSVPRENLVRDANGNLYGTTSTGGMGIACRRILRRARIPRTKSQAREFSLLQRTAS